MLSYLIIGSGYRAEFFGRIAVRYPELFRALFLCRSQEKVALMEAHTGVPATDSLDEALDFRPDFVVVAVDRGHVASVTREWAERGFAVVAETAVGSTEEELDMLWALQRDRGAKIVCCEQYHRFPVIAAGIARIEAGLIGRPASAYLSLAHDYHGISLIRHLLQTYDEAFTLRTVRTETPAIATDSRYGAILDGHMDREERTAAYITFASGKTAIYDFAPLQYRSFIRSRHLTVRGDRGEWSDRIIYYADGNGEPRRHFVMPEIGPACRALDTQGLRDLRKTWQPELYLDQQQDEFAIASMLLDMGPYLAGGPTPYPLGEALDDAYFWLLLNRAAEHPWEEFAAAPKPWRP